MEFPLIIILKTSRLIYKTKEQQAMAVILPVVSIAHESEQKNVIITDESIVKIMNQSALVLVILTLGVNLRALMDNKNTFRSRVYS
jgi:hypothetical protein